jgi:hypothetical protein
MARLGEQIPSSLHGPIARRLFTHPIARRLLSNSSRTDLSDTPDKQEKKYGRHVVKVNHGIAEKILLMLIAALFILCTIFLI